MYFQAILRLCGIPLLTADVLKEAWPNVYFHPRTPEQDHVVVPHDHARSLSASDYQSRVWRTVVARLLDVSADDESKKWVATAGLVGPPATDGTKLGWVSLQHPSVFNFRFVPIQVHRDELTPFLSLLPQPGAGSANDSDREMAGIAAAAAMDHLKTTLRQLSPFPDERLGTLVTMINLTGDRLADLSGFDLSAVQIISFVSQCPKIDALDISQNTHVTLQDVPTILIAAPQLLRLNVSGCSGIDGRALLELVRTQPSLFLTVEAIIHPAFLTIVKPPDFPVAFTFIFAHGWEMNGMALPLFTPTQVIQALCLLIPLTRRSDESLYTAHHESGDGVEHSGDSDSNTETGQNKNFAWLQHVEEMLDIPGFLELSAPMLVYSVFTSGYQREDQSWSDRAVIGVPLHPYPVVYPAPEGSWAFFLDWSTVDFGGAQKWAFIRYAPDADSETDEERRATPGERLALDPASPNATEPTKMDPISDPLNKRRGTVYDLRGFLRCMAEEGRPSPPEGLVAKLEGVLYSRRPNGMLASPLMQDADVPTALTVIPSVAVGDLDGDLRTLRRYTLASEVHPIIARFASQEAQRRDGQ